MRKHGLLRIRVFRSLALAFLVFCQGAFAGDREDLQRQLDRVFEDPSFHRAHWGIKVVSLGTGRIVYEKNPGKLFVPASNMKLFTAAAALQVLEDGFVFKTPVETNGKKEGSVLRGDLIVTGVGDPSLGARFFGPNRDNALSGDPWSVFAGWADELRQLGIKRIDGDLIGDDLLFEPPGYGEGWSWDDQVYSYSAGFGALQFNESSAYIEIRPGKNPGSIAAAIIIPTLDSMGVVSDLKTSDPEESSDVRISREGRKYFLSGQVPAGTGILYQGVALPSPTLYFLDMLKATLVKNGIPVNGGTVDIDREDEISGEHRSALFIHESPPLREILAVMLEVSQNQYAETLFRMLDKRERGKGAEGAVETMRTILDSMGVPGDSYEIRDGSGLSRSNLASPEAIVRVLQYMYRHRNGRLFMDMLPVSGVKGSIKSRMTGTRACERVYAKTGTLSWVRALSGYLETEKGEILAFSMLVNNYNQPRQAAEYLQDQALEILVGYE